MATRKKVHRYKFEIEIKSHDPNEKALKFELNEAIQYYFGMKNHLQGNRTVLNSIRLLVNKKIKVNGKNTRNNPS